MFRRIKSIFMSDEPVDRVEFEVYANAINLKRAELFSIASILLEIFVVITSFIVRGKSFFEKPAVFYLYLYILLLIVMPVFLAVFTRLEKNIKRNVGKISAASTLFAAFVLIWSAVISLLDQLSSGQIIIYTGSVILVAVSSYIKPAKMLVVYSAVQLAFLFLLPCFSSPYNYVFGNSVNSTLFIVLAWLVYYMRHKSLVEDFNNRKKNEMQAEELNRINRELRRLSLTDGLTGVYNRFMLEAKLNEDWEECKKSSVPLALIIIDVDYFKRINDNYGHQEGDKYLRKISDILKDSVQDRTNMIARYGGDEFAVLIPGMDQKTVSDFSERIRKKVEESRIPHKFSPVSKFVTVSLGACSVIPSESLTISSFVKYADDALYEAKKARNCHRTAVFERIYS